VLGAGGLGAHALAPNTANNSVAMIGLPGFIVCFPFR
jgi:hypothetical protein